MLRTLLKSLFSALLVSMAASSAALQNQLAQHPSPYLAMHGEDPVHWQDWSAAVLEAARREDKLLFVSSGYFACHWCHVMQRESYQNAEIAAFLNEHFIPVKVDRELEPALDAHLIDFVQKTQGRAGWPLNVFLSPEGYPVIGLTYAPADSFLELLQRLDQVWQERRDRTRDLAQRVFAKLNPSAEPGEPAAPWPARRLLDKLKAEALALGDDMTGGFGDQSRFPMTPQLDVLLEIQARYPDARLREFLLLTLNKMATEGLRDHLAGGFYRYTVDPNWQVPHYEKMLYTQAQLALTYLRAAEVLLRREYLEVAADTLDFVIRHLAGEKGGYIASLSAVDAQGVEGGSYLWTDEQLTRVLSPPQLALAKRRWRLDGVPATEGGYLPRPGESAAEIATALDLQPIEVEAQLAKIKRDLLEARLRRSLPRDTKLLAGWNGLMLAAFSKGSRVLQKPRFRRAAERLREFLVTDLSEGDRLVRARDRARAVGEAALEDYAYVAYGLSEWLKIAPDSADQPRLNALLTAAWQRFHDDDGWRNSARPLLPGMARVAAQNEGALPSPTAMLLRLSLDSKIDALVRRATAALPATRASVYPEAFWFSGHAWLLVERAADSG